ncbi:hypothetical protein SAMN06269117_11323 [Balnearium lithotrophicum]|uniref:Uncharacterized protein n=1 Tax=Balnearium lithotrophicum TaxID=223788 RepID=A0A521CLB0_9BACT|nr:hypothetical protein [Balnearium lithotrophicum]SMO59470.1 hypothetical protein SAMN06269117_11323 [Balnearium lithotrophicum]
MNKTILQSLQKKYPMNALQKVLKLPKNISLNQLTDLIRREFAKATKAQGIKDGWIVEIYKDYIIAHFYGSEVSGGDKYYKIPFSIDGTSIKFDFTKKVEVVRSWQEVK